MIIIFTIIIASSSAVNIEGAIAFAARMAFARYVTALRRRSLSRSPPFVDEVPHITRSYVVRCGYGRRTGRRGSVRGRIILGRKKKKSESNIIVCAKKTTISPEQLERLRSPDDVKWSRVNYFFLHKFIFPTTVVRLTHGVLSGRVGRALRGVTREPINGKTGQVGLTKPIRIVYFGLRVRRAISAVLSPFLRLIIHSSYQNRDLKRKLFNFLILSFS